MESNKLRVCPWLCFSPPSFLLLQQYIVTTHTHVLLGRDFLETKTAWLVLAPNKVMCTCVFLITLGRSLSSKGGSVESQFNRSSNYYYSSSSTLCACYLSLIRSRRCCCCCWPRLISRTLSVWSRVLELLCRITKLLEWRLIHDLNGHKTPDAKNVSRESSCAVIRCLILHTKSPNVVTRVAFYVRVV